MRVLIADDDPVARRLLERSLARLGHDVTSVADGAAALQAIQSSDFPLVVTDWLMPGLDGPDLVRRIRAQERSGYVYCILLTSLHEKDDLVHGMEAGADDFLSKPFDPGELGARVRQGERVIGLERSLAAQNQALRDAQAALVQQEKLASLGQLAAGVAHEINNPTAFVTNNLAVLKRDVLAAFDLMAAYRAAFDPAQAADFARREQEIDLDYIRETVPLLFDKTLDGLKRVRQIVGNLRDFARMDEATFKDVDVNAALTSTAEIIRHELKLRQIELRTDFAPVPIIQCHPGKVNQVHLNVLVNAFQACGPGGVIEVRTRPAGDGVLIEIADTGTGIKPEHLPHIFEPFFTTKPVGQGTGLGLSISYGIVRDHGGTIEAESEVGRGSTFRIRLPRRPPSK
jgi:two-component system NtrC family sensor kinase